MKAHKRQAFSELLSSALEAAHVHGRMAQRLADAQETEGQAANEAHEAIAAVYTFIAPPSKREVH